MKKLRNTVSVLCIGFSFFAQAGVPGTTSSLLKEKTVSENLIRNTNSTFVKHKSAQVYTQQGFSFNPSAKLDQDFVSGRNKKAETTFSDILHWDLKVKFKLNRNMTIIFSYN